MSLEGWGSSAARRRLTRGVVVVLAALAVAASVVASPPALTRSASAAGPPSGTAEVVDGAVTGLTQMGPWTVVAGTFTTLRIHPVGGGTAVEVTWPRVFAYDTATGLFDPGFRPIVNGPVLALAGTPGTAAPDSAVYLGGSFTTVNGLPYRKLVRVLPDGSVDRSFSANADNRVQALALHDGHLFVGGQFQVIRNVARTRLAELSAATGRVVRAFDLPLTGTAGAGGTASVQRLAVSPDGTRLLVAHTAQRIDDRPRYGVALVDLDAAPPAVDPWRTDLWSSRLAQTGGLVRVTSAAWGPDGSWFVVTNTGGDVPPINDCVQRFDVSASPTTKPVPPTWVTRMFDSTYAVAVGPDGSVYVGGHFQFTEAPGAADPYPGDPAVNYGGGLATQGARTLGQQVVNRPQVAALDPGTGQATNWWSSASGHQGVTALLVADQQVLIGSDGSRVDGRATGRLGVVPAADAPVPAAAATTTVTAPVNGANLDVGPVTVSGTVSAAAGVDHVQVEVKRDGRWLQPDGTWGSFSTFDALVSSPGSTSSPWSLDLNLPEPGDYVLLVRSFDPTDGGPKQAWHLLTNDPTNAPPTTHWTAPRRGARDFASHTFTVRGTANDPDGVAAVSLTFYNQELHSYVSATGEVDPFVSSQATLASPLAASTTWSLSVTLPDGHYTAYAKGTDVLGTTDPRGTGLTFSLFPGNAAPTVRITSPDAGARVGAFTVSGRAADDHGVSRVLVRVADLRFGMGAQPTGTYGLARWLPATLTHPDRTTTTWSVRVPQLPVGTYRVTAAAVDRSGVQTPLGGQSQLTVRRWPRGVTGEPRTTLTTPTSSTRFSDRGLPLGGTASYGPGVTSVSYTLFDVTLGRYLQGDGSLAATPYPFPADLGPGSRSRSWSAPPGTAVPYAGTWRVDAFARGTGAVDSTPAGSRAVLYVYPGDADPTVALNSPVDLADFPAPQAVTVSGRAFDDHGVRQVQVLVRNQAGTRGMRGDLTLGASAAWAEAFVTNVGGTSTNYNLVTPTLPAGTWLVSVRAVDSVGKPQASPVTHTITVG